MKLFGKDNQESGNKVGTPEKKNPSKQHPELKIISGNQISQPPSPSQKEVQPEPETTLLPNVNHAIAISSGKG